MLYRLGFPVVGRNRRLVVAIGIDALGSGVWLPLSVLYFTITTSLPLVSIGLALSISAAVAIPLTLVVGQMVDRLGAKRVLQSGNALQAVGFALYPLAHSWLVVALVVTLPMLGRAAFLGSYPAVVALVSEPGEREQWFGFLGALRNLGFAVGGLVAGTAVTIGTETAFHVVVLLNAASYVVSFLLLSRLRVRRVEAPSTPLEAHAGGFREVLRDRGYRWLVAATAGYALGCLALNVVMPIYVVRELGLPGWLSGAMYIINTVMVGIGQGVVVRHMSGSQRYRIVVLAAGLMAVGFALLYVAGALSVAAAVVTALVAAVVYTLGEMVGGPVLSTLAAEAPPEHLRGRYVATSQLAWTGAGALAPLAYLWLLSVGHLALWGGLVLVVGLGAACCWPMARRMPLASGRVTNAPVGAAREATV